jgi:amphi-Trp domain-containing protein
MAQKDKVAFDGVVSAQEAAQYLESLAKGLRERSMLLESGDVSIAVDVPEDVKIEIAAAADQEKGKVSIDLSLGWRRVREEEVAPSPGLLIVAGRQTADAIAE